MAIIEVAGDVSGDDGLVGIEEVEVAASHLGCHFKSNVEQLTEAAVIGRTALKVTQRSGVLVR